MSLYGDFEFIRAESEYRIERGRIAPWITGRPTSVRRRLSTRRNTGESVRARRGRAA